MTPPERHKFSHLFYNAVTYLGVVISLVVATAEVFLFALDLLDRGGNPYLGLFTYLLLPGLLFVGLALIPIGYFWKKRRIEAGKPTFELRQFRIDLSLSHHRNALLIFIAGTSCLVLMTLVGSYKAFHYTESVQFCGTVCHQIMHPEFASYGKSPHSRVKCVECHIGSGADHYLRSKLSGARQVLKALSNTYEKPIKTPVSELRPASETCEHCHWPQKFFGLREFDRSYFLTDGGDKPWRIRMQMNVGGGAGKAQGVHKHMNVDHDIYYAAEDDRRQKITWIKSVDKSGKETVYTTAKSLWKDAAPPPAKIRKMDCIDCHNRPTHQYTAPYELLNDAITSGAIDASIPGIKEKGMELLSADYEASKEALQKIEGDLRAYYEKEHPDYYGQNRETVGRASAEIQKLFSHNMFPEMKVRWDTHPDNIGHLATQGCFRCHDGGHRSAEGKTVTQDCNACHRILEQGIEGATERNMDGLEFKHPDGSEDWKEASCTDCHTGGA